MKLIITNAFSLNMLNQNELIKFAQIENPKELMENWYPFCAAGMDTIESAVGHQSTADIFTKALDFDVKMNRTTVEFNRTTVLLIGQYKGPRLEEGATELPEGATITWWSASMREDDYC